MDRFEVGMLAKSRAGHDKKHLYVIIQVEEEYVYLADGDLRPLEKPKKKNKKHIQVIRKQLQGITEKLAEGQTVINEELKRAVKCYKQEQHEI